MRLRAGALLLQLLLRGLICLQLLQRGLIYLACFCFWAMSACI